MNTYQRNGRTTEPVTQNTPQKEEEKGVKVDGFKQVLEMLCVADHEFRYSLLSRMETQDPTLVRNLRHHLERLGIQ